MSHPRLEALLLLLDEAPPQSPAESSLESNPGVSHAEARSSLEAAGFSCHPVTLEQATAQLALSGRIVICDRSAGWQQRTAKLEAAGAVVILLGRRPGYTDPRHLLAPTLQSAESPAALLAEVYRAQGRLQARSEPSRLAHSLLERAQSAELVSRFAQAIAAQFTVPQIVRTAVAKTRELCDAEGASLLLIDADTGELFFDLVDGTGTGCIERVRLKAGQGVAGKVAAGVMPMLVSSVEACPDFDPTVDLKTGMRTGSIIAVPLLLGGDVIGVLEAVRSVENVPFTNAHLKRLEDLAPHVAIAVHNAQITTELRRSQSEVVSANVSLERKVEERTQQISRAKKEWERTFDAIAEPIALQDGFVIRRTNLAYAQRVGLPITQLAGKTCHQVLAGRGAPCPGCPLLRGRAGELAGEVPIGGNSIFRFSGYWMTDNAEDASVVVHYQDVTHQRMMDERLRETERLAALGQLASGAAHEINNPLGFVTSNLRSLKVALEELSGVVGPPNSEMALTLKDGMEMIDESLQGAHRVAEIVKGLRELSRLEIGKSEPCCVNASVTRAVRAVGGEISLELSAALPAAISPLQLDQALGHILKNARQAVGGATGVKVQTESDAREVRVSVRDEGSGISPENLRRIFEPFFTTRGVGKGIGLGLTAAYGIVRRAGGEIEVHSEVGRGSTFTLRLPRANPPQSAQADA